MAGEEILGGDGGAGEKESKCVVDCKTFGAIGTLIIIINRKRYKQ